MIKEGKIGVQEAISLITITICVKFYFTSLAFVVRLVGTAAWYSTLVSAAVAIFGFIGMHSLLKRFPGKDIIEAFELSLGRMLGFIFSLVLFASLFVGNAILIREFAEVTKVYVLPLTPPSFVIGAILSMVMGACFLGLESIARFARAVALILLFGFLIVIILCAGNYNVYNLFPFYGYGLDKVVSNGFSRSSFYGEVAVLGVIAASMQGASHIKKVGLYSLSISGILTATAIITSVMAFNYAQSQEIVSNIYALARIISIGGFLQRLDPIFIFTWCIGTLISAATVFYASLSIYCKMFRIQDMRPVIIPAAIILFTICMMPKDLIEITFYVQISRQYGWIITFGLPLIALFAAAIRKKEGAKKSA